MKHLAGPDQRIKIASFNKDKNLFIPIITIPKELNQQYYEQEEK